MSVKLTLIRFCSEWTRLFMAFIRSASALFRLGKVLAWSNSFDSVPSLSRFPSCEYQLQITVSPCCNVKSPREHLLTLPWDRSYFWHRNRQHLTQAKYPMQWDVHTLVSRLWLSCRSWKCTVALFSKRAIIYAYFSFLASDLLTAAIGWARTWHVELLCFKGATMFTLLRKSNYRHFYDKNMFLFYFIYFYFLLLLL